MRLALLLERRYAPWRKWLRRYLGEVWTGDPMLLDHLDAIAGETPPAAKAEAVAATLDLLGTAANDSGIIPAQPLRADYLAHMHDFNFGGFANAYRDLIEGDLAALPLSAGPVDLWGSLHTFAVEPPPFLHDQRFVDAVYRTDTDHES